MQTCRETASYYVGEGQCGKPLNFTAKGRGNSTVSALSSSIGQTGDRATEGRKAFAEETSLTGDEKLIAGFSLLFRRVERKRKTRR